MVFVVFIQLFYCRKGAFIGFAAMLFTAGPFLDFCPLNFSSRKPLPDAPVIPTRDTKYFGLTVSPYDGDIYVADAIDYQQPGVIYRYTAEGDLIGSFTVGVNPTAFCWK